MKRRNFLKGFVAASVGLAFAPVAVLSESVPVVLVDWQGRELLPYSIYYDGKNSFMAVSKSELVHVSENISDVKPNGPLMLIASCCTEF